MKIQVLQENLLKGLNIAGRSVSAKAQLPVLTNVLLSTEEGKLKIATTNLEMGVVVWVGAKIEEEGAITLPAKTLQEYVSSLPADKIDFTANETSASLTCGSFRASFNGISAKEFPIFPKAEEKIFAFPSEKLTEVISQVAFASATDEGRPILTGVLVKSEEKTLSFAATDGYRLSVKKIKAGEIDQVKKPRSLVIPAKTFLEISRIIADLVKKEEVLIQMGLTKDGNQAVFTFPEAELSTRLLEGEFPDYEKIIPVELKTKITLDREEFVKAVKTASIFARDSANIVKFEVTGDKLTLSANSPQTGENVNEVGAKVEGESGQIAFNFRFILDFLNAIVAGEVVFKMTGSLNPGVFGTTTDDSLIHVIMPVRLQT